MKNLVALVFVLFVVNAEVWGQTVSPNCKVKRMAKSVDETFPISSSLYGVMLSSYCKVNKVLELWCI